MPWPTIAKPSLQTPTTIKDNSLSSTATNGMRLSRVKYTRQLRGWDLKWNALADTELVQLASWFATCGGGAATFAWSDEFGNNYTVRFVGDIKHQSVSNTHSQVSLTLEEA